MTSDTPAANSFPSGFGANLLIRAVASAAAALVITFSANHSSIIGQIVFMAYGFVLAPILIATAFGSSFGTVVRRLYYANALVSVLGAALMAALVGTTHDAPESAALRILTLVVGGWAALTGIGELLAGWFHTRRDESREMLVLGAFAAIFAAAELLIPVNALYAVGLFGAFAAISAVFAAIAGFSLGLRKTRTTKGLK